MAAAVQEALFEIEDLETAAELERKKDLALCEKYFAGWSAAGTLKTSTVVDGITFEDFRAAADRLAVTAARSAQDEDGDPA